MADNRIVRGKDDPATALGKLLEKHKHALVKALAKNLPADRLIRLATSALHRTPALQNCTMPSIVNSVVLCGVMGLEPNTPLGHAYLIPYKTECTFQPGYRGLMHLARRTAGIGRWRSEVVRKDDELTIEYGMDEKFSHKPIGESDEWVSAYSFAVDRDGYPTFVRMTKAQVLHIRDTRSAGYSYKPQSSPWTTDEEEMAKKTVIKRHVKSMDLSVEVSMATKADDEAETQGKQESFIETEFRELSEQAADANSQLTAGTVQEQEKVADDKIRVFQQQKPNNKGELGGQDPQREEKKPDPPAPPSEPASGPPANLPVLAEWPDTPSDEYYNIAGQVFVLDDETGNYKHYVSQAPQKPRFGALGGKKP